MSLVIIRLHPTEPISGLEFASYTTDLTITLFEISFNNLDGEQIAETQLIEQVGDDDGLQPVARAGLFHSRQ